MKIAFILFTNGLEYDDRIRKEMSTIKTLYSEAEIEIFAVHGKNIETCHGSTSYGVPYHIYHLKTRDWIKKGFDLLKVLEMYFKIEIHLSSFDLLWIIDEQPWLFTVFSLKKKIWDLHEIPAAITGGRMKNLLFRFMQKRCRCLIHANQERIDYLNNRGLIVDAKKNYVLRNFPDTSWMNSSMLESEIFNKFKQWLGDSEYIYLQGLNGAGRYPIETIKGIMNGPDIKAVVLGNVPDIFKSELKSTYGEKLNEKVYFVGQVEQQYTSAFIANCKFTIVLYDITRANNRYCEPNRLFQCLGFEKPAIVGCNEPMANIINANLCGVVLEGDGKDLHEISNAIQKMQDSFDTYKRNAILHKSEFGWDRQKAIMSSIFSKL